MTTRNETAKPSPWISPRVRWLTLILGSFLVIGAAWGVYWDRDLRYSVYTDDAYVSGNVVQITPQISGTVVGIGADNTQFVKAGQPLVRLDQADAKVALQQSEARLARTVRQVRSLFSTTSQLQANVQVRRTDLAKAQSDYARRARLARSGAISTEELQHAGDAVSSAQAAVAAAQQALAANRALIDDTTIESNPAVRDAAAALHAAYLTYVRTVIPAPVSGFVARRDVQLGERVSTGTPLMSVVPLNEVWVDANFKESQLGTVRVGQPVTLTSDLYGSRVSIPRSCGRLRRRHRLCLLAAARPERHRQLDQDRAARARACCPRPARAGAASAADRPVHEGLRQREGRLAASGCPKSQPTIPTTRPMSSSPQRHRPTRWCGTSSPRTTRLRRVRAAQHRLAARVGGGAVVQADPVAPLPTCRSR